MSPAVRLLTAVAAASIVAVAACGGDDDGAEVVDSVTAPPVTSAPATTGAAVEPADPELRAELLAMMEEDQAEQMGEVATNGAADRQARLAEVFDEHGWPGTDLVGEDGSTAAWVIAQHADLDPAFQQRALELLAAAVAEGRASPGDLAYLQDRVDVAAGREQTYGTQIRCGPDGTPEAATPIADEDDVEARRAEAGLDPLADYVAEMTDMCAAAG